MKPWTERDLAYLAGIIDGEGCILLGRLSYVRPGCLHRPTCFYSSLQISNAEKTLMDWLRQNFGGTVHPQRKEGNRRAWHVWNLSSRAATGVLEAVLPYLLVKREQAELFLQFRATMKRAYWRTPARILTQRAGMVARMRLLHRGQG